MLKSRIYDFVICRGGTDMCFVLGFGRKRPDLKQYRISGLTLGTAKIGGVERVFFRSANALRASSVHLNFSPFLSSWWNGRVLSTSLLMKRLSAASLPVSCCTHLMFVGSCILAIAWNFSGFASIPRAETM